MKKFALLAIATLAFLGTGCHRGCWSKDPAKRAECALDKVASKLGLDADQKIKALPIFVALATQREEWHGEAGRMVEDLRVQTEAEDFDQIALNKSFAAREEKLAQTRKFIVERLAEFHALLRPEQRKKATELLSKLEKHMQK